MTATRVRTTCTFCPFGCELEIVREGRRIIGVEYPVESPVGGGRLCPRGSASARLLDHPKRLCYPYKDCQERTWDQFFAEVGPIIRDCPSNEIAVTYDRNLTLEELEMVLGFANALGTDNVSPAYPESELHSHWRLEAKPKIRSADPFAVTQADILKAETILLLGDVFGVMPVIAKPILDARYADRSRRLYCIDSVRTRAAGFAHRFLFTKPDTEPLVLLALAGLVDPKRAGLDPESVAACSGIKVDDLREVAGAFDKSKKGLVIAAIQSGRSADPKFLSGALQFLVARMKGTKKLLFVNESTVLPGRRGFGDILTGIEKREIRILINLGASFPFEYPTLDRRLHDLSLLISTATMRPRSPVPGWILPVPLNLEKSGTVTTLWGAAALTQTADPVSGSRTVAQIIEGLMDSAPEREEIPVDVLPRIPAKAIIAQARELLRMSNVKCQMPNQVPSPNVKCPTDQYPFLVLAEKPAYSQFLVLSSWFLEPGTRNQEPEVAIHARDAGALGISNADDVRIETAGGKKGGFKARLSEQVQPGTLLVDSNHAAARALFEITIDKASGMAIIPPSYAKLWRSE